MHQRAATTAGTGTRPLRWEARLAGLVAGVAGLAAADLGAWLLAPVGAPISAVGELVIDLLPAPLVNFGKDTLGTADKPVLVAIITVAVLVVCAFAGQAELRRRFGGAAVFAVVAVLGLAGVAARAGAQPMAYLPTVVGLSLGYLLLRTMVDRLETWRDAAAAAQPTSTARRGFLRLALVTGGLAAVGAVAGEVLLGAATRVNQARLRLRLPGAARPAPAVPAAADLRVPGLSPYVTPNADFYRIDTALQVPVIDPDDWSLTIGGMVEQEVTLSYAELAALPLVEHVATLTCVSNPVGGELVGNALWLGYPIRDLLARARPTAGADMVLSTSQDGFTAGTPLDALTDPGRQALLAIGMNGEPLPLQHGFPVRMVVPGLYGYVSATKWVTELKVTTFEADRGYWTPLGWAARGPIKLASRIDVPRRTVDAGRVVVAGVAWAQHTGLAAVEVQVDGGAWQPAELAATTGPDTWRQWSYAWDATSGEHSLTVRATDADGTVQDPAEAPPAPDGASGYHQVSVTVR
ncbi:DMSO/TMAO reductase YedYZ, molybdopterin-dependent catalytic subunit [Friedmanniella luteola]|uniref:DMSO/TMAO reductase YedYZ, molybdopterin-dependent catalytic subunit n=1 Tax=Friedmanniella luteola TaxID=546871 RepID=A0A1H2A505_9ACTN|nr:molybdopterin-dependent oxidoreductase [Friedmanniella luteola]SDT41045.1 DMSO/TMAO reductase YedYZ, molybdopterin-dependent catalytic subunit [Friedmanniella luteola]